MLDSDKQNFASAMRAMAAYYRTEVIPEVLAIYWNGLKDLEFSAVRQSMNAHAQNPDTGQFMPKIADIRRMLGGTTQDAALVAWSKVDKALRQVGTYADVVFDDPLIHRTMHDMGGYIKLGTVTEKEIPFVAKEFENRYRGHKMRGEVPKYPPVMIGISGATNRKIGFAVAPPVLVGNEMDCLRVSRGGTENEIISVTHASEKLAEFLKIENQKLEAE